MARKYNDIQKNIAREGFFSEYLPPCFKVDLKAFNYPPISTCDLIKPYSFTMSRYNGNDSRRNIFIPEIGAYLALCEFVKNANITKELIEFCDGSDHSFSPILKEDDNIAFHEESYGQSVEEEDFSEYILNIEKKLIRATGAKKILKVDISNCYASFYMHMFPAIMLGAEAAEREYKKHKDNPEDPSINPTYIKYNKLDGAVRRQNLNQTNGLLPGTIYSKVFAEAMLVRIDHELEDQSLKFVRYVDDYEFFLFDNDEKATLSIVAKILKKYGFVLNNEKTEILDFPFYVVDNFRKILKDNIKESIPYADLIEIFNTFLKFEKNGVKGAIRYLLKVFKDNPQNIEDVELYKSYLITIMANNERSLIKACEILIEQKAELEFNQSDISVVLDMLNKHIDCDHDLEVIWLLYLLIETENINRGDKIIGEIVGTSNELAHSLLLNRNLLKDDQIEEICDKAESWLLLYELYKGDKISQEGFIEKLGIERNRSMYEKFYEKNIHFII